MTRTLKLVAGYVAFGLVFLAMDAVWLNLMGARLYRPEIGQLMAATPRLAPAVIFYLVYIAGVVGFCVAPAIGTGRPTDAILRGGAFGAVAYATYDLTNLATLRGWPVGVSLVDLAWGSFVTGLAATAGYAITRWFE